MGVADDAASTTECDHRRLEPLGQRQNLRFCAKGSRAHEDHRRPRLLDQPGGLVDPIRVHSGVGKPSERRRRRSSGRAGEHVPWHLQGRRPAPSGGHLLEGASHLGGGDRGILHPVCMLDEGAQGGELVGHFVQVPVALAEEVARGLAGQAQHRLVAPVGREGRGAGVEDARTRHHREGRRTACGARVTEGHVSARLLVPRSDHPHVGTMEGVEQAVDLGARQAEHRVDAVSLEAVDQGFAAGHGTQGRDHRPLVARRPSLRLDRQRHMFRQRALSHASGATGQNVQLPVGPP